MGFIGIFIIRLSGHFMYKKTTFEYYENIFEEQQNCLKQNLVENMLFEDKNINCFYYKIKKYSY